MNIETTKVSTKHKSSGMDALCDVSNIHLNLKSIWFDLILSGKKKEEYREIKPYYRKRLMRIGNEVGCWLCKHFKLTNATHVENFQKSYPTLESYRNASPQICNLKQVELNFESVYCNDIELKDVPFYFRHFKDINKITFSNGYSKNRRQFVIELLSIRIDFGKSEWGANSNQKYFVLQLGNIISSNCC